MNKNLRSSVLTLLLSVSLFAGCRNRNSNSQSTQIDDTREHTGSVAQGPPVSFVPAARAATPAVVHIKTTYEAKGGNSIFDLFGSGGSTPAMASGSGVVI